MALAAEPKFALKRALQSLLGLHGYLVAHAVFVAATLPLRRENGDIRAFLQRLRPDATVLDVGANVGALTLVFAKRCPYGRVFAFEPIPENVRAAEVVIERFRLRNVLLFPVAVGDRDGELEMVMPTDRGVRLDGLSHVAHEGWNDGIRYSVPAVRLDDFPALAGVRVDAIKLDVENHEQYVIRGARRIIERDRPLIYAEIWDDANMRGCREVLDPLGYRVVATPSALNYFFVP
jgi:FkbM family methyltransferase